jgi:hypothetical protein
MTKYPSIKEMKSKKYTNKEHGMGKPEKANDEGEQKKKAKKKETVASQLRITY